MGSAAQSIDGASVDLSHPQLDQFDLQVRAQQGAVYRVQTIADLASGTWADVGPYMQALTDDISVAEMLPPTDELRFFRILEIPPAQGFASPSDREGNVAITREFVLRLDRPLDASVTIDASVLWAEFGGERLSGRLQLSEDRQTLSLFFDTPMPQNARVRVSVNAEALIDVTGFAVDANGDGTRGGLNTFDFDTLSVTVVPDTIVCGRVFASELMQGAAGTNLSVNIPLAGATITVDGMEDTLFAVTDALGNFRLDPAPAGRFFVHIDGRTASAAVPTGAYYPFVGKTWTSIPGEEVTVGNVYLPLVSPGTLQPVSPSADTVIGLAPDVVTEFPEFADVSITVPANALFADDGTRGGSVGIAPVPPDRLPGTPPPELDFPLVITVQTDGPTNFDAPAPVCFPNVADPETGDILMPGEKTALWSFNHDSGRWEVGGPMTVSEDGRLICSDPGYGVVAPGWHAAPRGRMAGAQGFGGGAGTIRTCVDKMGNVWRAGFGCYQSTLVSLSGANCLIGAPLDAANAIQDRSLGDDGGGFWSGVGNWALGCTPLGNIAAAASCAFGLGDAADQYDACMRARLDDIDALVFGSTVKMEMTVQEQIIESQAQILQAAFGEAVWQEHVNDPDVQAILAEMDKASSPSTAGGTVINPGERAVLRGMARPPEITAAQVDNLISRANQTTMQYESGQDTHATAGRTDFIDAEAILDAIADAKEGDEMAQDMGWQSSFQALQDLASGQIFEDMIRVAGDEYIPSESPMLFLREDLNTGDSRRGQLNLQGAIDGMILAANAIYSMRYLDPVTFQIGHTTFRTGRFGTRIDIPQTILLPSNQPDSDGDGIPDDAEEIVGTDPGDNDTDNDGILDGAEVQAGTDPLDGLAIRTGILASTDTTGTAIDADARNDVVAIANGSGGVNIFNVFNAMNPIRVAEINTPGDARKVAIAGNQVAVADGSAGLALIDFTDPPASTLMKQMDLGGVANAVAFAAGIVYVGHENGKLSTVNLLAGCRNIDNEFLSSRIQDIRLGGDYIYVLTSGAVFIFQTRGGLLIPEGSVAVSRGATRLFIGEQIMYVTDAFGYDTYGLANPVAPALLASGNTAQRGWKMIAPNGSGRGVAAVSPNAGGGAQDVSIYDTTTPLDNNAFITTFMTPGQARAVSLYNGLAYTADGSAGLQVINFLAQDNLGQNPGIALDASFGLFGGEAEEGKRVRVSAEVSDDVQVRNVEFYLDGEKIQTDGNFPFEFRFITPVRLDQSTFTLQARVSDTGGNFTWTPEYTITLVPDATPPLLVSTFPADGSILGSVRDVLATFSEPMRSASLQSSSAAFTLHDAGPDGLLGNADDQLVPISADSYDPDNFTFGLHFPTNLPPGEYLGTVQSPLADLAGNPLAVPLTWRFRVFSFADADNDGLPDDFEAVLGLDPANPDTDGDSTLDGQEDSDGDGLVSAIEVIYGYDPSERDSDSDGIYDGNEDLDWDGLDNIRELTLETVIDVADTDEDGFNDEVEVTLESDPLDATSRPAMWAVASPPIDVYQNEGLQPFTISRPPVDAYLPEGRQPFVVARPPVDIALNEGQQAFAIARPPVDVSLNAGEQPFTVARPPLGVFLNNAQQPFSIANPPVDIEITP